MQTLVSVLLAISKQSNLQSASKNVNMLDKIGENFDFMVAASVYFNKFLPEWNTWPHTDNLTVRWFGNKASTPACQNICCSNAVLWSSKK